MSWDSFRQRVRYLRGEALRCWPAIVSDVHLEAIAPKQTEDGDESSAGGVRVWCVGTVPSHGLRKTTLLYGTIPKTAEAVSSSGSGSDSRSIRVPVAALRSVWMDESCLLTAEYSDAGIARFLSTAIVESAMWSAPKEAGLFGSAQPPNVVLLADKGRRWVAGTVADRRQQAPAEKLHMRFEESSVTPSGHSHVLSVHEQRENDWYYARSSGDGGRFVAFSRGRNVVIYDTLSRRETQVTNATARGVQYGSVDISMEEELGRTAGIFWAPSPTVSASGTLVSRLLCARVDESMVQEVGLPDLPTENKINPAADLISDPARLFADDTYRWASGCLAREASSTSNDGPSREGARGGRLTDFQRYPRPGTPNAVTEWVLVEIEYTSSSGILRHCVCKHKAGYGLRDLFPWCEYTVRAGWIQSGGRDYIWLQLLDRPQKRTAIVRIPQECFCDETLNNGIGDNSENDENDVGQGACVDVLYTEDARGPHAWVSLSHCHHFLRDSSEQGDREVRLILASERTDGFNHLHLVTARPVSSKRIGRVRWLAQHVDALTAGPWTVSDDARLFVDEPRGLVYFSARRPNPLTCNLFVTSYTAAARSSTQPEPPRQLTLAGYTHSHFAFDASGSYFYCQSSNLATPVRHCVYQIIRDSNSSSAAAAAAAGFGKSPSSVLRSPIRTRSFAGTPGSRASVVSSIDSAMATDCSDECASDTMSFYSAVSEQPQRHAVHQLPSARCLCVIEADSSAVPPADAAASVSGVSRAGSRRSHKERVVRRLSSESSSSLSLSSCGQSMDSIASDEYFVERLLSKLRVGGQQIQHSALATDLAKLKRLTPAYVSQRVTKAVRSALPFCSTPPILPLNHLLHSTLLQPLAATKPQQPLATAAAASSATTSPILPRKSAPLPMAPREPAAAARAGLSRSLGSGIGRALLRVPESLAPGRFAAQQHRQKQAPLPLPLPLPRAPTSLTTMSHAFVTVETLIGTHAVAALPERLPSGDPVPRLFNFAVPRRHGQPGYDLLFGHVYLPPDYTPGVRYPVVVNAYGGPQCQLVTNAFPYPRHRRLAMLARMAPALAKPGAAPEFAPGEECGDAWDECAQPWDDHVLVRPETADLLSARTAKVRDSVRALARIQPMVVVCVDGRGTPSRGRAFESAIAGQMGCVEVDDIVSALEYISAYGLDALAPTLRPPPSWCASIVSSHYGESSKSPFWQPTAVLRPPVLRPPSDDLVLDNADYSWDPCALPSPEDSSHPVQFMDPERVAIHGWSYGGYVALRALAAYPQWFRLSIAGAPVVRWDWYSAAYAERYLGLLDHKGAAQDDTNQDDDSAAQDGTAARAYEAASVLAVAKDLLLDRGRLVLVHGWNDDNVHVAHTAQLVRKLQSLSGLADPAPLSVYANERHGLRLPSSNEHFETLLSFCLFHRLQNIGQ
ncbi:hypothetical protein GGI07_001498 [Coemansia sp. Benny D115]|nr:hypothetical protein GGI07_001498 [Coemansia sp. Benny D115]